MSEPDRPGLTASNGNARARIARSGEVLDIVRRGGISTTAEIAAEMGVARSTVAERVERLIDHGFLTTAQHGRQGRGRPARGLRFNPDAGLVLAAQLGMSGTRIGVTNLDGNILTSGMIDVELATGPDAVLPRIEAEFRDVLRRVDASIEQVFGVGVGVPGNVELAAATGAAAASHPWTDRPISARLRALFGVPITVGVDMNLLALAEHRAFFPEAEVLLALKVGTAIGCGIVVGGRVVQGGGGLAGEIGHTRVIGSDAPCVCGRSGCLAAVASGAAVAGRLRAQGLAAQSSRDVAALARSGIQEASDAVREAGREIGEIMAGAVNLLNPDVIVVWGYLADAGDPLFDGMRESIDRSGVEASSRHVRLKRSSLGDDAGIKGAAITIIERSLLPARIDRYLLNAQDGGQRVSARSSP